MQQRPTAKKCTKATCTRKKKLGCFAINPNLFLFAVLVAVGRCLVFVEPTSAFRLNKISHLENLSSVDSDCSECNFLYRICSKTSKTKSKIITQLREASKGLKMKMLQFPTLESLW